MLWLFANKQSVIFFIFSMSDRACSRNPSPPRASLLWGKKKKTLENQGRKFCSCPGLLVCWALGNTTALTGGHQGLFQLGLGSGLSLLTCWDLNKTSLQLPKLQLSWSWERSKVLGGILTKHLFCIIPISMHHSIKVFKIFFPPDQPLTTWLLRALQWEAANHRCK